MSTTNDLMSHPKLTFSEVANGVEARFAMELGKDIVCKYWRDPNANGKNHDNWLFELERIEGKGGKFSHPSEHGCKIAIVNHLVEVGLIGPVEDNSHLDAENLRIAKQLAAMRDGFKGSPRVGDFVIMPDGTMERCASNSKYGMQTCNSGSFFVYYGGKATMSGTLNKGGISEYFQPTDETKSGVFWFFSHNRSGAGRRVDTFMPCRAYRFVPFNMTIEEARQHVSAKGFAKTWGENSADHLKQIKRLMEGKG